ncbi:DEAD/DEAH box helicase [Lacinutrix himadriensis]|uniref:DEAD/DEAH box helicase n=1 Tax=Lacinutrix himadriensis TaxID=641549 RepID=UPI0006E14D78|nr:DEAD/DEAH box helicase [Lacinutrix himadriensis]
MSYFKNITPQELTRFVSFYRDKENRELEFNSYNPISMQHIQAEGSAYLFNLLNEKKIALLADEVGMGKTIQSLAVCAALWQQKPDARILVLAPRNEVAYNWEREYETFIKVHYKVKDDIVKSRVDGKPINPAIFCTNLYDLATEVQKGWGKFFIGKISSFSSLFSQTDVNARLKNIGIEPDKDYNNIERNKESAKGISDLIRKDIVKHLPDGYFDLVIIDEAHYFRNKHGGSLRVAVAETFFNEGANKIAKKTLLLTATPNHSSSSNINAIVSYFDDKKYSELSYDTILDDICLRRFRRLSKQGKVKYNYRKEISRASDFKDNEMSELFFGIYQKQLVAEYMQGEMHGSRRNILGFLEGTEFIPKEQINYEDDKELKEGSDFNSGSDGEMLLELSAKYQSIFDGSPPSHPKYEKLNKDLIAEKETLNSPNSKKLVFVRRIPSVREIAARAIFRYDEILLKKINNALGSSMELVAGLNEFRKHFENKSGLTNHEEEDLILSDEDLGEDLEKVPTSKVMYLFKTLKKKAGIQTSTHASNFRLRFNRSKPSVFNIFFAPGADYFDKEYKVEIYKSFLKGKGYTDDHFISCLLHRTDSENVTEDVSMKIKNTLAGRLDLLEKSTETLKLPTLMTIFWRYLEKSELQEEKKESIKKEYQELNEYQKEAFSTFIEKGMLLASPALVDLYIAFIKASNRSESTAVKLYLQFTEEVSEQMSYSSIPQLIIESILNFKVLCEKVFNLTNEDQLLNEEWKNFWDAQPAYAYSGDTKNNRVMTSFNTPFYPDVLISTSVLQEGVNLQYFCDQIIHYGIAWTPGDNEQRVGRIDRMFSKIERNLDMDENSILEIIYPYLKNTIDQDHLANFISKKYFEENLIDKCQAYEGRSNLDPKNFNYENWKQFFRTPNEDLVQDPYPAKMNELQKPSFEFKLDIKETDIEKQVINTFKEHNIPIFRSKISADTICVLDSTLANGRNQPVIVKLNYDAQLTGVLGEVTYTLSLISPIGRKRQIKDFEKNYHLFSKKYEDEFMTVKLCLDKSQTTVSIFGIYAKIDLPVFLNHHENPLSTIELLQNYNDLIHCADHMEQVILDVDLKMDSFEPNKEIFDSEPASSSLRKGFKSIKVQGSWKTKENFIYLERDYKDKELWIRNIWEWNHTDNYVKHLPNSSIIPFYSKDVQEIELNAMEEIERIRNKDEIWN